MSVLITGATGAVGGEVLRLCLEESRVTSVVLLTRRPVAIVDAKLSVIVVDDFFALGALPEVDACFWALGVSQTVVKEAAEYRKITCGYTLELARRLGDRAKFLFVSAQGADPTMKSRVLFTRVKGETEVELRKLMGERLVVFRPGYIDPVRKREKPMWQDAALRPFVWFRKVLPWFVTDSREVAEAMLGVALGVSAPAVLENRDILRAAAAYRSR